MIGKLFFQLKLWWNRFVIVFTTFILTILFFIGYFWPKMVYTIHSGEAGVLWKRFDGGTVTNMIYTEGTAITAPWNNIYIYNLRWQNAYHKIHVVCADGLEVELLVSIRYRLTPKTIGMLHKTIGSEYLNVVIIPEVTNASQQAIIGLESDKLFSPELETIQHEIVNLASERLQEKFIMLDGVLINSINLLPKSSYEHQAVK